MNPNAALKLSQRVRKIDGWLSKEAVMLIAMLDSVQDKGGVSGDLFEIGVHRGKSAVLFKMLCREGESLKVCDLFDTQEQNVSRSGSGDRAIFEANVTKHCGSCDDITVFSQSSTSLEVAQIGDNYRMFHIDGGHNSNEALSDLILGAKATVAGGILIVDDPFRIEWPGVTEAVVKFLSDNADWSPLVVGFNKLVLVRREMVEAFTRSIDDQAARNSYQIGTPWHLKKLPFMDSDLRILYIPARFLNSSPMKRFGKLIASGLKRKANFFTKKEAS